MDKSSKLIRTIVEIAIFTALGFVFDELQGALTKALFPFGGSIGFALIVIVIISFRRGPLVGFLTGLIIGTLDFATGPYIVNGWQVLLDYILPYALVASSGFFKPLYDKQENKTVKLIILLVATLIGGLCKFMSHFLSGGLFFAEWITWKEFEGQPWLYSLAYNMAGVGPSIVLSMILLVGIYYRIPKLIDVPQDKEEKKPTERIKWFDYVINPIIILTGVYLFIFFLVRYVTSYEAYNDGYGNDVSFNQDALALFIFGILLVIIGGISQIRSLQHKEEYRLTSLNILILTISNFIYAMARLIRTYAKGKDPTIYWIWMGVALAVIGVSLALYIITRKISKSKVEATN